MTVKEQSQAKGRTALEWAGLLLLGGVLNTLASFTVGPLTGNGEIGKLIFAGCPLLFGLAFAQSLQGLISSFKGKQGLKPIVLAGLITLLSGIVLLLSGYVSLLSYLPIEGIEIGPPLSSHSNSLR